jgi:hypothetical protein
MKPRFQMIAFAAVTLINFSGCLLSRHPNAACKLREKSYQERAEKLKTDAHAALTIGTRKDAVVRFFEANGLPLTLTSSEASGTIHLLGCAPTGCGSDDAILGLRVKVDGAGTVISEPVVGGIYTDCL